MAPPLSPMPHRYERLWSRAARLLFIASAFGQRPLPAELRLRLLRTAEEMAALRKLRLPGHKPPP